MQLETLKYLYDIQHAAELAAEFTKGKSFADYEREPMLRLAVERAFSIVGEAIVQLDRVDPAAATRISEARSIIAFRNILVHAYAQIDDRLVWDILQSKLPTLVGEIAKLMAEQE